MSNSKVIIEQKYIDTDLKKQIVEMISSKSSSNMIPILVKGMREKVSKMTPIDLIHKYENKYEFFGPSSLDLRQTNKYNMMFLESLPNYFDAIDISPINPIGTNAIITSVSQDVSLSTIRGSEVNSDPTTALTLEAASRRKKLAINEETFFDEVHLATIHPVLRLQKFDLSKGYMQHFNLFGLVSSGRNNNNLEEYELDLLFQHIDIFLEFIEKLNNNGYYLNDVSVNIFHISFIEKLIKDGFLSRKDVNLNSLNDDYNLFKENNISIPDSIQNVDELSEDIIKKYKLESVISIYNNINKKFLNLRKKWNNVNFCIDFNRKAGFGYYEGFCYHIFAKNENGVELQLSDGGVVNWNKKLLSDKKEVSVTSGFGAELIQKMYIRSKKNENIRN